MVAGEYDLLNWTILGFPNISDWLPATAWAKWPTHDLGDRISDRISEVTPLDLGGGHFNDVHLNVSEVTVFADPISEVTPPPDLGGGLPASG